MKISDLYEYEEIKFTPPDPLPKLDNTAELLGELSCKIGKLPVYKINDNSGYTTFIVVDKNNKTLAFLDLCVIHSPYAQVKNAYCNLPNNGIMTGLYIFMVRHEHFKLISDYNMSIDGEQLWNAIIKKNLLNVRVLDLETGKKYSLEDASKQNIKTNDGDLVTLPKMDDRDKTEQRFMYIAESKHMKLNSKIIEELSEEEIIWKKARKTIYEAEKIGISYGYQFGLGEP